MQEMDIECSRYDNPSSIDAHPDASLEYKAMPDCSQLENTP